MTAKDPIGFEGGINLYAYVLNNPTSLIDPYGKAVVIPGLVINLLRASPFIIGALWYALTGSDIDLPDFGNGGGEDPRCSEHRAKIRHLISQMQSRYGAMVDDPLDLFNRAYETNPGGNIAGKGTWVGHQKIYRDLMVGLRREVERAEALRCEVPPEAYWWMRMPPPIRPIY